MTRSSRLPNTVWALGFVSLLMDVSSEMIHALLPVYLVTVFGASTLTVGIIEGIAESAANITRVFSGVVSDWIGRRKLLAVTGYGFAAATKPVFALATSIGPIFAARFLDRVGKGIRGSPRDALIADVTPPDRRGAAFGLRQSLDTIGAVAGPLIAIALMAATANSFRTVFLIAVIPAALSMMVLVVGVHEPRRGTSGAVEPRRPKLADYHRLGKLYFVVLGIAFVLTLARFSEAFLVLRARDTGLTLALLPLVLVVMNVAYSLSAYPAGLLADRHGRPRLLAMGALVLLSSHLVLAMADSSVIAMVGIALWGLHMGLTQGILSALVADFAPPQLRGTAFGVFNLVIGMAMLVASVVAGALWDARGPAASFVAGAAFAFVALVALLPLRSSGRGNGAQSAEPPRSA